MDFFRDHFFFKILIIFEFLRIQKIYISSCAEVEYLFPTCQVRIIRFYQSCSPSSFSSSSSSVSSSSSSSNFSSIMPASISTSTSALPTRRQSLRQLPRTAGTAGPQLPASDLTIHGWTSTASERSGHCWTSTTNGHRWTST